MLGRRASPESSSVGYDDSGPQMKKSRPLSQPDPRQVQQQGWYPPSSYYQQYLGGAIPPYPNNLAPYPQFAAAQQPSTSRWDGFDPYDEEEEQERRKKGKELIPFRPMMTGPPPPPWAAYPGAYGQGAYGPLGNPMLPGLPPGQPTALPMPYQPVLPFPNGEYPSKKPAKHVRHQDQPQGAGRRHDDARGPHQEITLNREVHGILTPDSGDLTVHLAMDLEEDLEQQLDEMNRLSRLGHFLQAREFFSENLQHHIDNPYVVVQYADLLLHQGDFKGVTLLKDDAIYKREGEQPDSEELRMLRVNWELIQILAKSYTLDTLSGTPTVLEEAVNVLADMGRDGPSDRPISSTEVGILALVIRLTGHPVLHSKWLKYASRALAALPTSLLRFYQTLLRQGRIWDFHDFVVLMPTIEDIKALTHDIFGKDLIPSLQAMVSDWSDSVHGYDASTTLGLLSILTHILLDPVEASEKECIDVLRLCLPLAISMAENDPGSLKSRPYLRLLLAKSRFAETASRQAVDSLQSHLQSSQGVFYQHDIALLPIYVPSGNETPQWTPADQPSELRDPVRLVLRSAVELGDFETEVLARRELIRLSASPQDEFGMLCTLQLSRQGDLNGYGLSLASRYLVSNTTAAKEELAIAISRLLSRVASTDYWDPSLEWILNMLLYKLEGMSPSTIQRLLERNNTDYQNIDESLLREISRKMPVLKDWADRQKKEDSAEPKLRDAVLRAGSDPRRNSRITVRQARRTPGVRRAAEPLPTRRRSQATPSEQKDERAVPLMSGSKPPDIHLHHRRTSPQSKPISATAVVDSGHPSIADQADDYQVTPRVTFVNPSDRRGGRHIPSPPSIEPVAREVVSVVESNQHDDDDNDVLETQIRKRLEAEYNKKFEVEKELERERRNERMAVLDGFKKQVEAIRRETVEQAEKKARVEAQERAEQQKWERYIEERKFQKEIAMAEAAKAATELDTRVDAARKAAAEEAQKKMEQEFELREKKENEALQQAELEIKRRMEAEKRAYEEAKAAEKMVEELRQKVEAEKRERQEAEARAFEAAVKRAEEEEYRAKIRQWADERVERDLENQSRLHFKDAVGRKYAIPFNQGRTWEVRQISLA
ncbi:hypothetical protein F5Y14DRAFT_426435 [Nemania sp. NC0429]|nr:hypothetical protein F5Y14DRAFT_426435 [Nemania sp. NC0429]